MLKYDYLYHALNHHIGTANMKIGTKFRPEEPIAEMVRDLYFHYHPEKKKENPHLF